jgi:hypothetical protein
MPLRVVTLKLTAEEVEALDALTLVLSLRSRAETIREGLRLLKPSFATNPFGSLLVKNSRSKHCFRIPRRRVQGGAAARSAGR